MVYTLFTILTDCLPLIYTSRNIWVEKYTIYVVSLSTHTSNETVYVIHEDLLHLIHIHINRPIHIPIIY